VLIPQENAKDLPEIPDNVKQGLTIIPVSNVREVLQARARARARADRLGRGRRGGRRRPPAPQVPENMRRESAASKYIRPQPLNPTGKS
jgi:hypothetical protein